MWPPRSEEEMLRLPIQMGSESLVRVVLRVSKATEDNFAGWVYLRKHSSLLFFMSSNTMSMV